MPSKRSDTGAAGEAYVAGRLEREGYDVIERNWRTRVGELDIVALDDDVLVFVEVRVRTGDRVVMADETVDAAKLTKIMRAAEMFVAAHPEHEDRVWRIDFVAITLDATGAVQRYRHYDNLTLD